MADNNSDKDGLTIRANSNSAKAGLTSVPAALGIPDHVRTNFNLTRREREVCVMVLLGKSVKVTAKLLNISPRTVGSYREHVWRKLGVHNVQSVACKLSKMGDLLCL